MFIATPLWLFPVDEAIAGMPSVIVIQILLLLFVLSPWGPKVQPGTKQPTSAKHVGS